MGALFFVIVILAGAALLDKLLPDRIKDSMVEKFLRGGERFGRD